MFDKYELHFIKNSKKIREALKGVYNDTFKNKCNESLLQNCFKDPLIRTLFRFFIQKDRETTEDIKQRREKALIIKDIETFGFVLNERNEDIKSSND